MEAIAAEYLSWLEKDNRWLFQKLMEFCSIKNRLKVSFLFNAYQPRCNRIYKVEKQQFPENKHPYFNQLYSKIMSYSIKYGIKRKERDNLIAIATTDCYLPLLAIADSFPNAITIAFPQITLDEIKNRYPDFILNLLNMHDEGKIELGISSYHHSFAPLLDSKLLEQEYSCSLSKFISSIKKRDRISVHIPECAISPSLIHALSRIQYSNDVNFVTALDSDYHNKDGYYDIGKVNRIIFYSEGKISSLSVLFSNNYFSRKLFSFPPNSDPKQVGFWYFTRFFESIAKPQPYPYWEKIMNGEPVRFTIHTDAETIGFYVQERVYSLYLMLDLMKNFNVGFSYLSDFSGDEIAVREGVQPLLYKTWDMETNGTPNRWIKKEYDSSTQFFLIAKEIFPPLLEEVSEKEQEMDRKERKRLWIAKARWANALTSCPHWWSEPNSVAGKQFARDVTETGRQLRMLSKFLPPSRQEILKATERLEEHPFIKRALAQ